MSDFIEFTEQLIKHKKTKPKKDVQVTEDGFVVGDSGEVIPYADFFKPFLGEYVSVSVKTSTKEEIEE